MSHVFRIVAISAVLALTLTGIDLYFDTAAVMPVAALVLLNSILVLIYRVARRILLYVVVDPLFKLLSILIALFSMIFLNKLPGQYISQNFLFSFLLSLCLVYFLKSYLVIKYGIVFTHPTATILLELLVLSAPYLWFNFFRKIIKP